MKLEWNSEYTQLQLTCVAGTVQSSLSYLATMSLGHLSHCRGCQSRSSNDVASSSMMSRSENGASLKWSPLLLSR